MTSVIKCRYCGGDMEIRELGLNKEHRFYYYECPFCMSRSPQTLNEVTANSMARMRPSKEEKQAV